MSDNINRLGLNPSTNVSELSAKPQILVAGCGTGQHSIATANKFKNSCITAIDLSLNSLGYAKLKTEQLGITNIEYLQADILDLDLLNKDFDVIESVGVLHHMADPVAGWKVPKEMFKTRRAYENWFIQRIGPSGCSQSSKYYSR